MRKQRPWFLLALLPLVVANTGCTLDEIFLFWGLGGCGDEMYYPNESRPMPNASGSSDTQTGQGVLVTPGVPLQDGRDEVHAVLGYNRLGFDGGRDDLLQIGAQYRRFVASSHATHHPWVGGEATFLRVSTVPDIDGLFGADNPSASGFTAGVVGAYPVSQRIPLSVIARAGVIHVGDFSANNVMFSSSDTAPYVRVGLDLDLQSMIQKK